MRESFRLPAALWMLAAGVSASAAMAQPTSPPPVAATAMPVVSTVAADRWVEVDLYWFNRDDTLASTRELWARCAPLFKDVQGWRGIVLNVGWVADSVLDWPGSLTARIPIPAGMQPERRFAATSPLRGDTADRQRQWKDRFAQPTPDTHADYGPWTYEDLKRLAGELRQVAESDHGLSNLRVGVMVTGRESLFGGAKTAWAGAHPEAFRATPGGSPSVNITTRLASDTRRYGAFPRGIPDGTPFAEFFGAQWGSYSRAVGLDALVLREGLIFPGRERRSANPGPGAPLEPEQAAAWTQAAAALVRASKMANPRALVIGYSSGGSAIGDWRVDSVDLEAIAREGHLDAFVDQSRGGAWGEAGVREALFWNRPHLGWTYQLAHILTHAAMLAETRVRHYVLTETFDAWESWDVIHTAPERLRWAIWAYHHAAVKQPGRLRMPAGSYISWANQGRRLLEEGDVAFLTTQLNEAIRDARATQEVYGPTLVYNRAAIETLMRSDPSRSIGEWIDDQLGTVAHWPVPFLSATRIEHLPEIHTDLPILATPQPLGARERDHLVDWIRAGQPIAIFASPAGGLDPEIARLAGLTTQETRRWAPRREAALTTQVSGLTDDLPTAFATVQPFSRNTTVDWATPVHTVDGSPVLVVNAYGGKRVLAWDPPEIDLDPIAEWHDKPLVERLGSIYPYLTVARTLSLWLRESDSPLAERIAPKGALTFAAWRLDENRYRLLFSQLAEGLGDSAEPTTSTEIALPDAWAIAPDSALKRPLQVRDVWADSALPDPDAALRVELGHAQSRLYEITPR